VNLPLDHFSDDKNKNKTKLNTGCYESLKKHFLLRHETGHRWWEAISASH
jgi:hypothetical protein